VTVFDVEDFIEIIRIIGLPGGRCHGHVSPGRKGHVHPIVRREVSLEREGAGSENVHTVGTGCAGWRVQRWVVSTRRGEVIQVVREDTHIGVIGGNVSGIGRDRYWRPEAHLLPARCRLASESTGSQQRATARPERSGMRTVILRILIEPDAGDGARHVGAELDAHLHWTCRTKGPRNRAGRPDARCGGRARKESQRDACRASVQ
jgi:hypothetical protein